MSMNQNEKKNLDYDRVKRRNEKNHDFKNIS